MKPLREWGHLYRLARNGPIRHDYPKAREQMTWNETEWAERIASTTVTNVELRSFVTQHLDEDNAHALVAQMVRRDAESFRIVRKQNLMCALFAGILAVFTILVFVIGLPC